MESWSHGVSLRGGCRPSLMNVGCKNAIDARSIKLRPGIYGSISHDNAFDSNRDIRALTGAECGHVAQNCGMIYRYILRSIAW